MSLRIRLPNHLTKENGSLTIEASLITPLFIFSIMLFTSFANQARTESIIQHALSQTAKEISTYFYISEKIEKHTSTEESTQKDNNYLKSNLLLFLKSAQITVESDSKSVNILNEITELFFQQKVPSDLLWQAYIETIFQKNILNIENVAIKAYLQSLQIYRGEVDFSKSTFLQDGKSIRIVAEYQVKSMFSDIFNKNRKVKQIASTSAWIHPVKTSEQTSISKWKLSNFLRGKAWLEEIRKENADIAVKLGSGIDLYENGICIFIYSLNVFTSTYCSGNIENGTFDLNKNNTTKLLETYLENAQRQLSNLPKELEMKNGNIINTEKDRKIIHLQIIVPEEAISCSTDLYNISDYFKKEKGVEIVWLFREKAL